MQFTCKYCGGNLTFLGYHQQKGLNYFSCDYCDLIFDEKEISKNRERRKSVPESYDYYYNKKTKDFLQLNTIELFHMLKDCRKDWFSLYSLLQNVVNANQKPDKKLYDEFVYLTKQRYVIENIILERTGFLPEKITGEFLNQIVEWGESSSSKPMYIFLSPSKKNNESIHSK